MKVKENLGDLFWKIVLPMFRFKWWIRDRRQRREFRRHQEWEYMLHSWKTCAFIFWYEDSDKGIDVWACTYRSRFQVIKDGLMKWHIFPSCKKSLCKNYVHDPAKEDGRLR